MDDDGRAGVLGRCALFSRVPEDDLRRLAATSSLRRYRRGQFAATARRVADRLLSMAPADGPPVVRSRQTQSEHCAGSWAERP